MKLRQRILYMSFQFLVVALNGVALTYDGWPCSGPAFSDDCQKNLPVRVLGILLLIGSILSVIGGIMMVITAFVWNTWTTKAALLTSITSNTIYFSGLFYFHFETLELNQFFLAIVMPMSFLQAALLAVNYFSEWGIRPKRLSRSK